MEKLEAPAMGAVCHKGWDAPARAVRPCTNSVCKGSAGPRQTMGAAGEHGGRGGSARAPPPRPGKQVTPYQLGKQTPKQSVGLDFDEPDMLSHKK